MYPIVERDITTLSWPEAAAADANRRAYPKLATPAQQEERRFTVEENAKRKDVAKMSVKPIKLSKIAKYIRKKVKSNTTMRNKNKTKPPSKPKIRKKQKESSASRKREKHKLILVEVRPALCAIQFFRYFRDVSVVFIAFWVKV